MVRLWDYHCCNCSNNNQEQKQRIKPKNIRSVCSSFVVFAVVVWCLFFLLLLSLKLLLLSSSLFIIIFSPWFCLVFGFFCLVLISSVTGTGVVPLGSYFFGRAIFFSSVPQVMVAANCTCTYRY